MDSSQVANQSDIYEPSVDETGRYIDRIPVFNSHRKEYGIRCPCSKREHIYKERANFSMHTKAKCHQDWLEKLNQDQTNYFAEASNLREIVNQQKLIIAKMEKEQSQNKCIIGALTDKINTVTNLARQMNAALINCECNNLLD
jgi:hypothetical protein